jgi:hypothetical protein
MQSGQLRIPQAQQAPSQNLTLYLFFLCNLRQPHRSGDRPEKRNDVATRSDWDPRNEFTDDELLDAAIQRVSNARNFHGDGSREDIEATNEAEELRQVIDG